MVGSQASVPSKHKEKFMEISEQSFAATKRCSNPSGAALGH